jgi:hypothetical protein
LIGFTSAAIGQPSSAPTAGSAGANPESSRPREIIAPEARVAVNKGVEFLKAERYKDAIDAFTAAARRHPVNGQFRLGKLATTLHW